MNQEKPTTAARTHCEHPEACQAKMPGRHCRRCNMRRLHQDPAFRAANAERSAERLRRLQQDPEFRGKRRPHLAVMTADQRADYDTLRGAGYSMHEALAHLGLLAAAE